MLANCARLIPELKVAPSLTIKLNLLLGALQLTELLGPMEVSAPYQYLSLYYECGSSRHHCVSLAFVAATVGVGTAASQAANRCSRDTVRAMSDHILCALMWLMFKVSLHM